MTKLSIFLKDLCADGYKVISVAAPLLSILFTLAKWREWTMVVDLKEVSYAWAFLPITIWFLIAYIRRWIKSNEFKTERDELRMVKDNEEALDDLSKLFDEGNNKILNNYTVTNDAQFGAWHVVWEKWGEQVQDHLEKHFGLRERNLFKNIVLFNRIEGLGGINDDHNKERSELAHQLQTIREIIVRHSNRVQKWREANI